MVTLARTPPSGGPRAAGRTVPVAAASAAWRVLTDGRRVRRAGLTSAAPRPSWAEYATTPSTGGPAYFLRELFDLNDLRGLDRPHVSVDVAQFDRSPAVVQVETSAYSVPVQLEPDEARLFAAALDEGARLVDRARAVTR